jgi:hypothetical protein
MKETSEANSRARRAEAKNGQDVEIKRKQANKGHSLPGEGRSWNKLGDGRKASQQGALTC